MPPSLLTDEATIATDSSILKPNGHAADLNLKTVHRIIYCSHSDITYEGRVLLKASSSLSPPPPVRRTRNSPPTSGKRKKKKDTKTAATPSLAAGRNGIQYVKHGKGTIHDHSSGMTLSGYFQYNQVVGHALQTLYDPGGRGQILAQYEGSFLGTGPTCSSSSNNTAHQHSDLHLIRHGKGKFIWHTTNDVYLGEFSNGEMEGIGTFTWGSTGDRYEGPFKKGRMHGNQGKKYTLVTGDVFEGSWKKGQAHGWGRKDFGNGDVFQGCYSRDVRQGFGSYLWQNGDMYIGQWEAGRTSGRGLKILMKDQESSSSPEPDDDTNTTGAEHPHIFAVYHGEWEADETYGSGVKRYSNGDIYHGASECNMRNGYGVYTCSNGDVYEGFFVDGHCSGQGMKRLANGDVVDGEWVDDKVEGYGVKTHAATGDIHMGYYKDDERHGHGLYRWSNGNEYEGNFEEGEMHGFGEYRYGDASTSSTMYRGQWHKGRKDGPGYLRVFVRGVERVLFDIFFRGTRLSRRAIRSKWEDIPTPDQLRCKRTCMEELKKKEHFISLS